MALAIVPLLALRIVALPRIREHAVTAGLGAGLLLQVPVIASARRSSTRLSRWRPAGEWGP